MIGLLVVFTVEYKSELSTRVYPLKLSFPFSDSSVVGNSVVGGFFGFSVTDSVVGEPLVSNFGSKFFASWLISVGGNSVISCSVVARVGTANLVVAKVTFAWFRAVSASAVPGSVVSTVVSSVVLSVVSSVVSVISDSPFVSSAFPCFAGGGCALN